MAVSSGTHQQLLLIHHHRNDHYKPRRAMGLRANAFVHGQHGQNKIKQTKEPRFLYTLNAIH